MTASLDALWVRLEEKLDTLFSAGSAKIYLAMLGQELGDTRKLIEAESGMKLGNFIRSRNEHMLHKEEDTGALYFINQSAPTVETSSQPISEQSARNGEERRFIGSFWSAFLIPLTPEKIRVLDISELHFRDQDPGAPVNGRIIPPELLCPAGELDKPGFIEKSIEAWLAREQLEVEPFIAGTKRRKKPGDPQSPKQHPVYPNVASTLIEPILDDAARYKTREEAWHLVELIRSTFTTRKLDPDESRDDYEIIWIYGFGVSSADFDRGIRGNYARIFVEEVKAKFHVRAQFIDNPHWGHPTTPTGWRGKKHPNWGVRILRKLQKGPVFYDDDEAAQADMDWLVITFEKVIRLSNNKIACMVFRRGADGKSVEFDKIQIRLAYDPNDRPFLYLDWQFHNKLPKIDIVKAPTAHDDADIEHFINTFHADRDNIQYRVGRLAAREILNWEGRNKFKAISRTGADNLYHYTSTKSAIAVLESQKLWLTDMQFMNDMSEIVHGYGVIAGFLASFSGMLVEVDGMPDSWRADFLKHLDEFVARKPGSTPIFGICLTDTLTIAAHWLAYGGRNSGVALGFNRSALWSAFRASTLNLRKVHYHTDRKNNILFNILKSIVEDSTLKAEAPAALAEATADILREMVPLFKHESFYTENEWRIIRRGDDADEWPEFEREKGDTRAGLAAPYIVLDVQKYLNVSMNSLLSSITIGPGALQEERRRTIEGALRRLRYREVEVFLSDIPLGAF